MRILSVELLTDDVDATAGFYTSVLGLPLYMNDRNTLDIGAGTSRRAGDRERGDSDGEGPRCRPHSHLAASGEGFGAPRRLAMKSRYQ